MRPKVAFHTLGCKLNFSETSTIARKFEGEGFDRTDFNQKADVYVINTCSVTENADKRFAYQVRQAQKHNPEAFIVAVGCYAQLKPKELAAVNGVDLVLGASEKFKITDYLNDLTKKEIGEVHSCDISEADFYVSSYAIGDRTRAFLKVQDGCDYKCSFCTIPLARGISRSDTIDNILRQAKEIATKGIKEIVLTGVNIGDYGKGEYGNKKHEHTFLELIQALDSIEGIHRIRISSIEPNLLKDPIIEFVAAGKSFVPHFHIPLQSGSNALLKTMKRRYVRETYTDRVRCIKQLMPHA
ncbi:MAG: MiaB/RimO family radical SAM methylthiotransferase, partial [Bacteroidia bacterium]|nr:MiaB/RimO family radical SAM methylthiotransferase [Bacteroidia bacterium]